MPVLLRRLRLINLLLLFSMVFTLLPSHHHTFAQSNGSLIRYEDSSPAIVPSGPWASATVAVASGGTLRQSKTAQSTLSLTFTGPWVSLGLRTTTNAGRLGVSINGVSRGTIDLYSTSDSLTSVFYTDLGAGTHTLTLTVLGQKHPSATDTFVYLDYIDVWNGTPLAPGTFEHDAPQLARSSNWTAVSQTQATKVAISVQAVMPGWASAGIVLPIRRGPRVRAARSIC